MEINVGKDDRAIRVILGSLLMIAPFLFSKALWNNDLLFWGSVLVGFALVLSGAFRVCLMYRLFGADTSAETSTHSAH